MSEVKLGSLIAGEANRDAIHIAIAPVTAGTILLPGQRVSFTTSSQEIVGPSSAPIGIVDPFLMEPIMAGQRFYLLLFPNTVTSLTHNWTHPAFEAATAPTPSASPADESRRWIEQLAASCGFAYQRFMDAAANYAERGDYLHMGENESYKDTFWGHEEEFWRHYEIVTGEKVDDRTGSFFSCSC